MSAACCQKLFRRGNKVAPFLALTSGRTTQCRSWCSLGICCILSSLCRTAQPTQPTPPAIIPSQRSPTASFTPNPHDETRDRSQARHHPISLSDIKYTSPTASSSAIRPISMIVFSSKTYLFKLVLGFSSILATLIAIVIACTRPLKSSAEKLQPRCSNQASYVDLSSNRQSSAL